MLTDTIPDLFAEAISNDLFACLTPPRDRPTPVPQQPSSVTEYPITTFTSGSLPELLQSPPAVAESPHNSDFNALQLKAQATGIAGMTEREKDLYRDLLSKMRDATETEQPTFATKTLEPLPDLALPSFVVRQRAQVFAVVVSDSPPPDALPAVEDTIGKLLDRDIEGRVLQCEADQDAFANMRERLRVVEIMDDPRALSIAQLVHPAARIFPKQTQRMLAAAARQLFGPDLDTPVDFLLVWTKDACEHPAAKTRETGFAGDVMALASISGIPIVNLASTDPVRKLRALLSPNHSEDYHAQH